MSRSSEKGIRLHDSGTFWYLEGFLGEGRKRWRAPLGELPVQVGRHPTLAEVRLPSRQVSALHARVFERGETLWIRDLGSRNGTFLNGCRIVGDRQVAVGDHVRFGDLEFRVGLHRAGAQSTEAIDGAELARYVEERVAALQEMLDGDKGAPHFQPIVDLEGAEPDGLELLSRGEIEGSTAAPAELFFLAERAGAEARLSRWFREIGLVAIAEYERPGWLFVNVHPAELDESGGLIESLEGAKKRAPNLQLVVEVHETALANASATRSLRAALHDLGMRLAVDDFGAGQKRLRELGVSPPDYLKYDMGWIRGLDGASHRRRLLRELLDETHDLGIRSVAEGVEEPGELEACRDLRFDLAQGFFLGLPRPLDPVETGPIEREPIEREPTETGDPGLEPTAMIDELEGSAELGG